LSIDLLSAVQRCSAASLRKTLLSGPTTPLCDAA
jgi:hypothetical protein